MPEVSQRRKPKFQMNCFLNIICSFCTMRVTNTKIHTLLQSPTALHPSRSLLNMRQFTMYPGDRTADIYPTSLGSKQASLVTRRYTSEAAERTRLEFRNTEASIFFSLVAHRMNINYSSQVSKRGTILTRLLPARGVSCSRDFRAGGWRGRVSGACSLQGPWGRCE